MFIDHHTLLRLTKGYLALLDARKTRGEEDDVFFNASGLVRETISKVLNVLEDNEILTTALHDLMVLDVEYLGGGKWWGEARLAEYVDARSKAVTHYEMMLKMTGHDLFLGPIKRPVLSKK